MDMIFELYNSNFDLINCSVRLKICIDSYFGKLFDFLQIKHYVYFIQLLYCIYLPKKIYLRIYFTYILYYKGKQII